jgi:predicted nucleotidyltransferase
MLRSRTDPTIAINAAEVGRVVEELFPEALGVWVYGSFADGYARPDSDLDVAILPDRPIDSWDRHERAVEVSSRLGRTVDLVDLRTVPLLLRFEALRIGKRVAARDPLACDRFESLMLDMYQQYYAEQRDRFADIEALGRVF